MSELKFSIVVPTYNRAELLISTLESLLNQEFNSFEVIVVDDGSTDNTEDLVLSLGSEKLRYYKVSNRERGAARNYGAQQAKGMYVNFFDSDDLAYVNHCSLAAEVIENSGHTEVFALSYDIRNPEQKILKTAKLSGNASDFIAVGNHFSCNGVFLRRDIALKHPFSENRELSGSEDYELWFRLAARYSFPCSPKVSHAIIQHESRSTLVTKAQPLIDRNHILVDLINGDKEVQEKFGNQMNKFLFGVWSYVSLHLALGNAPLAQIWTYWKKALKLYPLGVFSIRTLVILKYSLFR